MNKNNRQESPPSQWRTKMYEVIFEADTPAGKAFDILLIASILGSVIAVMLDSIASVNASHGKILNAFEWFFTLLFSVEYALRLISVGQPLRYANSFFGIVDLLSILPTYMSLLFPGTQYLAAIRLLRVLRVFRVLKLTQYLGEAQLLLRALSASRRKILVFLFTVLTLVVILGSLMYVVEGNRNGFNNIPQSIYWAVVTLTTVGYGDITPITPLGRVLAAMVMICGYGIIAVPTGIVTVELSNAYRENAHQQKISTQTCSQCAGEGHDPDAEFCKYCGAKL